VGAAGPIVRHYRYAGALGPEWPSEK
jgi:hypothetical protein